MAKVKRKRRQRKRVVVLAGLNVAADPHPEGVYERLFKRAAGKSGIRILGDRKAEIGEVQKYDGRTLTGQIWSYTYIDRRKRVVNLRTRKVFTRDEVSQFLTADFDERGLNFRSFWFGFDIATHLLVYERSTMSPWALADIVEKILHSVMADVGVKTLNVSVVQDAAQLDRIFALSLNRLEIKILRPNPADLSGLTERFRARLQLVNAKSETIVLEAEDGEALTPNEEVELLSALASTNGYVSGRGYDENVRRIVRRTTTNSPMLHHEVYDPKDGLPPEGFMANAAPNMGQKVTAQVDAFQRKWADPRKVDVDK